MSLTPPLRQPIEEAIESWTQLPRVLVIHQDGAGSIEVSDVAGELRASQTAQLGNQRQAFLTSWRSTDSEVVSLWGPPSTFTTSPSTNKPQIGHLHRVNLLPDGRTYQAIAVFHDAFLGTPTQLHCEGVLFDGALRAQVQDQPLNKTLAKALRAWFGRRITFGGQIAEYTCEPRELREIEVGDVVRVDGMAATGLNTAATGLPVHSIVADQAFFRLASPGIDVIDGAAGGVVTWVDATNPAKDRMPYWVRSRVDGNRLRVKQWVANDSEPRAWDHDITLTDDRIPTGDGWNGAWVGHVHSGSFHRFRHMRIKGTR